MQAAKYIQQISRSLIRHSSSSSSSSSSQLANVVTAAVVASSTSNSTAAVAAYSTAASALMFSSQLDLKNKSNTTAQKLVKSAAHETQQQRRIEVKFFNDRIKFKILEPTLAYKSMPYIWLRANCMCPTCYNRVAQESEIDWARTDEMSTEPVEIEETTRPIDSSSSSSSSSNESTNVVRVTWSDGHKSEYELAELARLVLAGCDHSQQQSHRVNSRILWNRHSLERCNNNGGLARLPYQAYMNDNNVLRLALANLYKFGAVIVNQVISI